VTRQLVATASMVDQVGKPSPTQTAPASKAVPRYRKLALTALNPLARPTEAMVDAAHAAVWFDAFWAINSRVDFKKAVRAMIRAAIER
jgi:hypothetical protein